MEDPITIPLPWQSGQWEGLVQRHLAGNLPHAILLSGVPGLGKSRFARAFGKALLCDHPDDQGRACGSCRSCQQFEAGSHPDFKAVVPEEGKSVIAIDQCRALADFMALKSHYGRYRIVILEPAEQMNVAAANSLLKTLEEPPAGGVLILVSHQPHALLPTIRSRCQQIGFTPPAQEAGLAWLQHHELDARQAELLLSLSGNAPLRALQMAEGGQLDSRQSMLDDLAAMMEGRIDITSVASRWAEFGPLLVIHWLQTWLTDMVRLKSSAEPPVLNNPDIKPRLQQLAQAVDWETLYAHLDRLGDMGKWARGSMNPQMMLEDFLITWTRGLRASKQ